MQYYVMEVSRKTGKRRYVRDKWGHPIFFWEEKYARWLAERLTACNNGMLHEVVQLDETCEVIKEDILQNRKVTRDETPPAAPGSGDECGE